jgi:hypothetical protein
VCSPCPKCTGICRRTVLSEHIRWNDFRNEHRCCSSWSLIAGCGPSGMCRVVPLPRMCNDTGR